MKVKPALESSFIQLLLNEKMKEAGELVHDKKIDWDIVRDLISYHEIAPYLYRLTRPHSRLLPEGINEFLFCMYWYNVKNSVLKDKEYIRVFNAFAREKIDLLPIKGVALLQDVYTDFYVRQMCDIDVLIAKRDYKKSDEIFNSLGYKKELLNLSESYWLNKQCHVTFIKGSHRDNFIAVDLHLGLDFKRRGRTVLPNIWDRTRELEIDDSKRLKLLSPEDTLFSLALHQRRFGKVFCLKYILDTSLLLRKYKDRFDWDYMLETCKRERVSSSLYFLLLQTKLFFNSGDSDILLQRLPVSNLKKKLMRRFIASNICSPSARGRNKDNYLRSHFLLYDDYVEPVQYIINIPIEQFAKFYGLKPYNARTRLFYRLRFLYILFFGLVGLLKKR